MKAALRVGNTAEIEITVTEDMCPAFDDVVVHKVYSTWSLAHHMELAARKVLAPHLEPDEEGIGAHLSIDHLAPTPLGHRVRVVARAIELEPTRLVCDVEAYHVRGSDAAGGGGASAAGGGDPAGRGGASAGGGERLVARGVQVQRILPKTKLEALIKRAER